MALAAAQVIDALAARLAGQAGLGTGGVKTNRIWPWAESDLPACRVFATDEQASFDAGYLEHVNAHTLNVDVQYSARATADLDDQMHAAAAAGLALLFAPPEPYRLQLVGITRRLATEGVASVGVITLRLQATCYVAPSAPETIIT